MAESCTFNLKTGSSEVKQYGRQFSAGLKYAQGEIDMLAPKSVYHREVGARSTQFRSIEGRVA